MRLRNSSAASASMPACFCCSARRLSRQIAQLPQHRRLRLVVAGGGTLARDDQQHLPLLHALAFDDALVDHRPLLRGVDLDQSQRRREIAGDVLLAGVLAEDEKRYDRRCNQGGANSEEWQRRRADPKTCTVVALALRIQRLLPV
jgi:hypothetical protein